MRVWYVYKTVNIKSMYLIDIINKKYYNLFLYYFFDILIQANYL